jgi:hypothetical protein
MPRSSLTTDGLLARPLLYGLIRFAGTLGPAAQLSIPTFTRVWMFGIHIFVSACS